MVTPGAHGARAGHVWLWGSRHPGPHAWLRHGISHIAIRDFRQPKWVASREATEKGCQSSGWSSIDASPISARPASHFQPGAGAARRNPAGRLLTLRPATRHQPRRRPGRSPSKFHASMGILTGDTGITVTVDPGAPTANWWHLIGTRFDVRDRFWPLQSVQSAF